MKLHSRSSLGGINFESRYLNIRMGGKNFQGMDNDG